LKTHRELHRYDSVGWLRAAVLGANDGLISTTSLVIGVASAQQQAGTVLLAGLAALVGGALSMAAGEYVSVSSQSDSEKADLARERHELATTPEAEHRELVGIYRGRGLSADLAERVATELAAHDALGAHARDELGITEKSRARPTVAALASALSFSAGAAVPLILVLLVPERSLQPVLFIAVPLLLMALGALAAKLGGAPMLRAALRVGFWGVFALAATSLVGRLFGAPGPA